MKALILSAGQGRRLLPLTDNCPKCALPVLGRSLIEWQIDELATLGIERVTVVVGYGAEQVERLLTRRYGENRVKLLYNPDFADSDNLVSCWIAREEMNEDFILLNGDTLFEVAIVKRLLEEPAWPVTVVTDKKISYDQDDMKVTLAGKRLVDIGKNLEPAQTDAEAIGMILFCDEGPFLFREAVEKALENPSARKQWYLSVIREMSQSMPVWTCSISGLSWCEVDFPEDLRSAQGVVRVCVRNKKRAKDLCQVDAVLPSVRVDAQSQGALGK
jgi:choline kinase